MDSGNRDERQQEERLSDERKQKPSDTDRDQSGPFSAGVDSAGSALLQPDDTSSFRVPVSGTHPEADGGGGDVYARQVAVSAYPETIAFLKSAQRCTLFLNGQNRERCTKTGLKLLHFVHDRAIFSVDGLASKGLLWYHLVSFR